MKPDYDAIGRRRRDTAMPTGRSVILQPRDLVWFEMLHRHGALPLPYLHEFTKAEPNCTNAKMAGHRATHLFHEGHLSRPHQQFATLDARYQTLCYENRLKAERELRRAGRWQDRAPQPSPTHWRHDFMLSCFTASIHLGTLGTGCRYIFQDEILARADASMWFDVGHRIKGKNILLRPDRLFGIQYPGGKVRLFIVEADCATEPIRSKLDRKSFERNAAQYRAFIGRGLYKDALKVNGGLLVIHLTTSEERMRHMMEVVEEISGAPCSYSLFGFLPMFAYYFKPPPPMPRLFTDPWERVGSGPFVIATP